MVGTFVTVLRSKLEPAPVMLALKDFSLITVTAFSSLEDFNVTLSSYGSPNFNTTSLNSTEVIPRNETSTL